MGWLSGIEPTKEILQGTHVVIEERAHIKHMQSRGFGTNPENLEHTHRVVLKDVRGYLYFGTEAECEKALMLILAKGGE